MTVYLGRSQDRMRLRPTLRLRLTLLNGILLVGAGYRVPEPVVLK